MILILLFILVFIPAVAGKSIDNRINTMVQNKNNGNYTPPAEPGLVVRMFRIIFWVLVISKIFC